MRDVTGLYWRSCIFFIFSFLVLTLVQPAQSHAQLCTGALISYTQDGNSANQSPDACGTFCHTPILSATEFTVSPPGCDPKVSACGVTASTAMEFPGNHQNFSAPGFSWATVLLTDATDNFIGQCGTPFAAITQSLGTATFGASFDCADLETNPASATFKLKAISCFMVGCETQTIGTIDLGGALDCTENLPPLHGCGEGACGSSCFGPGGGDGDGGGGGGDGSGGSSAGGGGPGVSPGGSGPGARLRYQAGGAGSAELPIPANWSLGRGWSHDYALAIAEDPDASHVWLITEFATYREFTDSNADDLYETVAPSDEYRTLRKTGSGWSLTDLDGTVTEFDNSGRWLSTADRNGNTKIATYSGDQLSVVEFPDGRSETFTYHPDGKLATLTEVGVDGITSRSWSYTWAGDDLERLERPDGTAWRFEYSDPAHPGFMTRMVLVGTDDSERILGAWEYDVQGNVIHTWQGTATFEDPAAVQKWSFSFDDPQLPTETMITDPLDNVMTYTFGRDPASDKPRLENTTGDCPTCGLGPNSQLFYEDPLNPLLPTRQVDGSGVTTLFTYDTNGGSTSRVEAFETDLERETIWTFDPTWPALSATVEQPSVEGFPNVKLTTTTYDASGNPDTRTIDGFENGVAFSYVTDFTHNAGGQVTSIDPPGFGIADQTSFTYDPTRGNGLLVLETRTDPLIGTTTFGYDAFNRRTSVVDVNGVVSETSYDALDRVTKVIQRGETLAEDLITAYHYDVFGSLFQTVLPEGNVIEYSYDLVGRLHSLERKADDQPSTHGERVVYTYDGNSNRVLEEHEVWDGASWVKRSQTETAYSTRCQPERIIRGFGGEETTTEMAYDCDGNLERLWDANHPSNGQSTMATSEYVYDELNRLTELRQPFGGAGGVLSVTTYGYDVQDHLNQVIDAEGTVTNYLYSDRDLLVREVSEVSGTTVLTYNEHGALATRTDARGITETRTVDELNRVLFVDFLDDSLDVTYSYDTLGVPFSLGRLTSIGRDGHLVAYTYDRFGRVLQDGELTYGYDKNGNATEIEYPGGMIARYAHDYADRESTLVVERPGAADQILVASSAYEPAGPLASLSLGNGLAETRNFDTRYFPASLVVDNAGTPVLNWQYTTDAQGHITNILDGNNAANHRDFAYQDYQYFLTQGNGPWGDLSWTYDRIGNRLSETRDGVADAYVYVSNAAGGNSPALDHINVGVGGQRIYQYDAAGNQIQVDALGSTIHRAHDEAGRMTLQSRPSDQVSANFFYDGRGFLRQVSQTTDADGTAIFCDGFESGDTSAWGAGGTACPSLSTKPLYSSAGTLHARNQDLIFYFRGRPVAQLGESGTWILLTLDHLGSPVLATDLTGNSSWQGGFEPFGADYTDAEGAGVFLRLPGQWGDPSWAVNDAGDSVVYNLYRWYQPGAGRYGRIDPVETPAINEPQVYSYVAENPLRYIDPLGLFTVDSSCDGCTHPFLGPRIPRSRLNLTRFISKETSSWCQTRLGEITNIALRKCIEKSCREGVIRCSNGDLVSDDLCGSDGATQGFTQRSGEDFGHWARRNGALPQTRTAIVCANSSLNFEGRAGETVIHEWAHGCGWNADKEPFPEGIPRSEHF